MSDHQLSKLTTGMVKPALIPGTNTYSTLHDAGRPDHPGSTMQEYYNDDVLAVDQPEPPGFKPVKPIERQPGLVPFDMDRNALTAEFYQKLESLKKEHQKTLKMLEKLYVEADTRCHLAKHAHSEGSSVMSNGVDLRSTARDGIFLTEDESIKNQDRVNRFSNGDADIDDSLDDEQFLGSIEDERQNVRFRETVETRSYEQTDSDRYNKIEEMWDDFRLKDYLPPDVTSQEKAGREKVKKRPKSAPVKKEAWSPVITIPKPFSMTVRAEMKREKSHTRSSEEVARAARERMEQEELELRQRVRAKDPPAHTFLPLFEEIMERQEQRSRMNRENASRALQMIVQPFSFMERENQKEKERKKQERLKKKKEKQKIKSMVQFVAKPVPACVHDPSISDRIKEDQLYRKIKVQLRSEDLMRSSALPPRMQSHEMIYAERKKKRHRDIRKANKLSFRPETHNMPDFETLHRRNQLEQSARKMELETTVTEPFELRTLALRKKKMAMEEANRKIKEEEGNFRKSMNGLKKRKHYVATSSSDSIPTRLTEAARLRIVETQKSLAKAEQELEDLKQKDKERMERRKKMAREVTARTMMTDKDAIEPDIYRRERLRQFQKQQKARQAEYQKELRNMNDRLKQRPYLFEQQAQNSARLQAEKRYQEILRSSGLSDDYVQEKSGRSSRDVTVGDSQDDYSDDEFETSIIKSGPNPSSRTEDSQSEIDEEIKSGDEPSQTSVKKHLQFDV